MIMGKEEGLLKKILKWTSKFHRIACISANLQLSHNLPVVHYSIT